MLRYHLSAGSLADLPDSTLPYCKYVEPLEPRLPFRQPPLITALMLLALRPLFTPSDAATVAFASR